MVKGRRSWAAGAATLLGGALVVGAAIAADPPKPDNPAHLAAEGARSIMDKNCARCHGQGPRIAARIDVTKYDSLIATHAVVPNDSSKSKLITAIQTGVMPPGGHKLADADIGALKAWVDAGAPDWAPTTTAERARDLLQQRCAACHGGAKPAKGLDVTKWQALVASHTITPKDAAHSKLVNIVIAGAMPPAGPKLTTAEVQTLQAWVETGAPDWAKKP